MAAACEIIQETFPDSTIAQLTAQNARPGNETVYVEFTDRAPVYAKVDLDDMGRVRREIAAVRYAARHASVNVPEIVRANSDGALPFMITTPLAGTLMNNRWTVGADRAELLRSVGATIGATHSAQHADCGVITGWRDDSLHVEEDSWTETLCATVRSRVANEFSDRFTDIPDDLIDIIRAIDPTVDAQSVTLLHGDPSRINIHVEPNGLLDWERALVGDPVLDIVETMFHHLGQPDVDESERPALREALLTGYRTQCGAVPPQLDTYEPLYKAIAHLLVPQTFEKWAPDVDTPIDELEANVREEAYARMATAQAELVG